ncbi:hypothetical protein D6783_03230, partial [Candidatus Woesearchaeota archaeon]
LKIPKPFSPILTVLSLILPLNHYYDCPGCHEWQSLPRPRKKGRFNSEAQQRETEKRIIPSSAFRFTPHDSASLLQHRSININIGTTLGGWSLSLDTVNTSTKTLPEGCNMNQNHPVLLLNNCHGREHTKLYGKNAFYDLYTTGYQANMATDLRVGQVCIVASKSSADDLTFSWYSFEKEELLKDNDNTTCRVFFGSHIRSETMPKSEALRHRDYSEFFDKNGNFIRRSVIVRKKRG